MRPLPLPLPRRLAAAALGAFAIASLLLPLGAGSAVAKEGLMVAFDAPIAFDTPPGTELLVGMTVTALDATGEHPVFGSPIVLILTGKDGTTTEAHGIEDNTGHYVMRIEVPPGGARDARVVMRGTSNGQRSDIDLMLITEVFAIGGITAMTAQAAPAPTPAPTPAPRATAAAVAPAASSAVAPASAPPASAPEAATAPVDDGSEGQAWMPPALALVALGVAVVVAIRLRAGRRTVEGS
jgi:hypothetical protein